jgi:hypothetical protein
MALDVTAHHLDKYGGRHFVTMILMPLLVAHNPAKFSPKVKFMRAAKEI